jgi:serine/threonine-protein kinase
MQRYGMLLADGGNVALTARSDRFTASKWAGLLGPHDLRGIRVTDFELVDSGPRLPWSGDCVRTGPLPAAPAFLEAAPARN